MAQVQVNNQISIVPVGTLLSDLLLGASHPCGGKGSCGKCKVQVTGAVSPLSSAERRHLTVLEIADGIRLACQTRVQGDCWVETGDTVPLTIAPTDEATLTSLRPDFAHYGAVVDIGTTTMAARLYSAKGALLAEIGVPNPQIAFGADVITRVESTLKGNSALTESLRQGLRDLLTELTGAAGLTAEQLEEVVVTGNTVMLTLLTGGDVVPFATAPFTGYAEYGESVSADSLGLGHSDTTVYLPPCASAFIGGDTSTALAAVSLKEKELLLDIGTNSEMVLNVGGTLYACSTAAGPAFEGVGISCGMVAAPGAIERMDLVNGSLHPRIIGGGEAVGFCGSGLVDALACLSLLEEECPVWVAPGVTLTAEDKQALLTAKSAIRSGVDTLLRCAGITAEEVAGIMIAGGFGRSLNLQNAVRIGLLPPVPLNRIRVVGNATLNGASRLLLDCSLRESVQQIARTIRVVDLATNPYFADRFIKNMTLEVPR